MSEKVKVTAEQGRILKKIRQKSLAVTRHIRGWTSENFKPLSSLSMDEFIRALYIGYEVEPEFKVGDWVVYGHNGRPQKIVRIPEDGYAYLRNYDDDNRVSPATFDYIRHATESEIAAEKERRWLSEIGRVAGEIKPYDIVTHEYSKGLYEVVSVEGDGNEANITENFADSEVRVSVKKLTLDTPREHRLTIKFDRLDGDFNE